MSSEQTDQLDITKEHVLITNGTTAAGGTEYTVYLDKEIGEPHLYRNLVEFLGKATESDEFVLKLNGPGGRLDTCVQLVHAIQHTKATVTGELVGEVCSAHANIFVACDDHKVYPYAAMMVHTLSGGAWGKGEDIVRMGQASNAVAKVMYEDIYDGFLTPSELVTVLNNNQDLWFVGADEINRRLEDLHTLRSIESEELEAEKLKAAEDELIETANAILATREDEPLILSGDVFASEQASNT